MYEGNMLIYRLSGKLLCIATVKGQGYINCNRCVVGVVAADVRFQRQKCMAVNTQGIAKVSTHSREFGSVHSSEVQMYY